MTRWQAALRERSHPCAPHARDSESKPHRPASLQRDQSRVSEDDDDIHVIKRNGKKEVVRYDKITSRIKKLCYGLDSKYIKPNVRISVSRRVVVASLHSHESSPGMMDVGGLFFDFEAVRTESRRTQVLTQKVIQGVYDGVTTHELDELAAQTAAYMATQHPDFSRLAARISVPTQRRKRT